MKLLIIDDELLIRKGLQTIISWKQYGFTTILEAQDASEGLRLIREQKPELVLMDIRMQEADGLWVTARARAQDFHGRIIIISGYSDFSYAQTALHQDVTAYLLKPVDPDELTAAIEKALAELEKESLFSLFSRQPMSHTRTAVLTDLITGKLIYDAEMEYSCNLRLNKKYFCFIACRCYSDIQGLSEASAPLLDILRPKYENLVLIEGIFYLLLTSPAEYSSCCQDIKNYLGSHKKTFFFIFGQPFFDAGQIADQYKALCMILKDLFYYADDSHCYKITGKESLFFDSRFDLLQQTQDMLNAILTANRRELSALLIQLQQYLTARRAARDAIGFILGNCYWQIVSKLLLHYPMIEVELLTKEEFTNQLCEHSFLYECIDLLQLQLQRCIDLLLQCRNLNPCEKICRYVEENYASALKLQDIAEEFGYNYTYLGRLFKKEKKVSFNTYVDQVRIQHAKTLLDKNASVTQTAQSTGFHDMDYFTKKFKKYVGCSPSEYKKRG